MTKVVLPLFVCVVPAMTTGLFCRAFTPRCFFTISSVLVTSSENHSCAFPWRSALSSVVSPNRSKNSPVRLSFVKRRERADELMINKAKSLPSRSKFQRQIVLKTFSTERLCAEHVATPRRGQSQVCSLPKCSSTLGFWCKAMLVKQSPLSLFYYFAFDYFASSFASFLPSVVSLLDELLKRKKKKKKKKNRT